jgi:hypothetical protein
MTPDREQIISRAMLDAENRHGNASEQFAVGKEVEAVSLGDRAAAHISGKPLPNGFIHSMI